MKCFVHGTFSIFLVPTRAMIEASIAQLYFSVPVQSTSSRPLTQTMSATGDKFKQIRSTARDKAAPR